MDRHTLLLALLVLTDNKMQFITQKIHIVPIENC
jgi:hypothetical protein